MNTLALTVRTTAEITLETKDETTWIRTRVAHNDRFRETSSFFTVVAFNGLAKAMANLAKGEEFTLVGRLESETYEKDGQRRESVKIIATEITYHAAKPREADEAA